ncbi:MAG: thrombospondin type 3 repeat-containing protein, partial [Saprospiraceae bacterium]
YSQNGISFPPPNFGGLVTVALAGGTGDLSFAPNQYYTFVLTINSGNTIVHLTPNEVEVEGSAYFNGVFYAQADMKFIISQTQGCRDADNDGVCDDDDNCPSLANADQADNDGDGEGDACDDDDDNDGILDADELACGSDPMDANSTCEVCDGMDNDLDGNTDEGFDDTDADGIADCVDTCPLDPNNDADGDGVCGNVDNCPTIANADQADNDGDGDGDVCDDDDDNDGILDYCDSEPFIDNYTYSGFENLPASWICGKNNDKVLVCHGGNNPQTNCISGSAVQSHLNHGDYLGECTCEAENFNGEHVNANSSILRNSSIYSGPAAMELLPNPAGDQVNVHLHGLDQAATLTIYDQMGRMVLTQDIDASAHNLSIDLTNGRFGNGVYMVRIHTNDLNLVQRLVITK